MTSLPDHHVSLADLLAGGPVFLIAAVLLALPFAAILASTRRRPVPAAGPPPGWFPDNQNPDLHRCWTGTTWTEKTRPATKKAS